MVELADWLHLHDRKQRLYQQDILQRQQEHLRGSGTSSPDLSLPTLKEWRLMNPRLTPQLNLVTGPPTQEALEISKLRVELVEQRQHVKQLTSKLQQQKAQLEQQVKVLKQHEQQITDLQQHVKQLEDERDICTGGTMH